MDFFSVLMLLGGVAFFLFGMNVMSTGLEKMSGGRLERTLKKATSSTGKSLALGAGITIAIQSSSAMTVMLVGLVNSGIMQLRQTIGVIMGSNIGTTLTAWITGMAGIDGDNFLMKMLQPKNFSPIFAVIGIVLIMVSKKSTRKDIGQIMLGFAVLMFGMTVMGDAVSPLSQESWFQNLLVMFTNPVFGVLVGAVFTGIIQSSAASVAVLQTLAQSGGITYGIAIPIIMGQNIGTCVTALISSIGVNKNAKRVAVVHICFNIIGTIVCLIVLYAVNAFVHLAFMEYQLDAFGIAAVHTVFNLVSTALLLPFARQLEKLACLIVRDKASEKTSYTFLDERLLNTPSFAIAQCRDMTIKMGHSARETLFTAIDLVDKYDEKLAAEVVAGEQKLDMYEDKLGTYMIKLSAKELSDDDSHDITKLLHIIGDLERIGDHALNIMQTAQEINEKKVAFSQTARSDLAVAKAALNEIINMTITSFDEDNIEIATQVEPLEQVIDELIEKMRSRHIERLQKGDCTIEQGFIWSDLLVNYERVSDHCSNIAVCIIQIHGNAYDIHGYKAETRTLDNPEFMASFEKYKKEYQLARQ